MPRLRRVGEQIGYGYQPSNEDLARVRMAELRQRQVEMDEEREMMIAQQRQQRWAQTGATRAPRRPFTPQTHEEYEDYSPPDVHRGTVRRMDDATSYDFGQNDLRIAGMPNGMHMMDDVGLLEDILMDSIEDRKQKIDRERQERDAAAMQQIAYEEAQLSRLGLVRDDGTRLSGSGMTSGRITRTANERDASSGFGLRDYASMERARERHQAMLQNVSDRRNSIRRKFSSPEERRQEIFDRERQRSSTIQERFAMSQTLGNLSDRLAEMQHGQGRRPMDPRSGFRMDDGYGGGYGGGHGGGYEDEYADRMYGRGGYQGHTVSYV